MIAYYSTFETAFGEFSAAVDENGSLLATAFGPLAALKSRLSASEFVRDESRTTTVRAQVMSYCAGERRSFSLPLAARGTSFQHRVWSALRQIPFGETRSYGQLAAELGNPAASRAVGRANASNPICLVVPCHRVIGADGSLTGFAFGETIKRQLLEHERVPAFRAA